MSFVVSVDGQPISTNGIIANIVVGIPPTPWSINTDFASGIGADGAVTNISKNLSSIVCAGSTINSYNLINGSNPSQFNRLAAINTDWDVYQNFLWFWGGANGQVRVAKKLSNGKYVLWGSFTYVWGVSCNYFAVLNSDFSVDTEAMTALGGWFSSDWVVGYTWQVYDIAQQSDGKLVVVGAFYSVNGTACNRIVRLNTDWSVDTTFTTNLGSWPTGGAGTVLTVAIQTDGKIIFWWVFTSFSWNSTNFRRIVRRNSDGTADGTWTPWTAFSSGQVNRIILQSDGKIICCGTFTSYNATTRQRVCRLLTTGAIDTTFGTISWANSTVNSVELDSSGNIYIVGNFTTYAGNACNRIARLTTLGAFDATYTIGTWFSASPTWICKSAIDDSMYITCPITTTYGSTSVKWLVKLASTWVVSNTYNKWFDQDPSFVYAFSDTVDVLLVGGASFSKYNNMDAVNGAFLKWLLRLSQYGTLVPWLPRGVWFNNITWVESNDDYIVAKTTGYNGSTVIWLIKFDVNGVIDTTFKTNIWTAANVSKVYIDSNGKFICIGAFTVFNGNPCGGICRLNSNGTFDSTFNASGAWVSWWSINKIHIQENGKIMLVWDFTTYNWTAVKRVIRINSDGSLDTWFTLDESTYIADQYYDVIYANNKYYVAGNIAFIWSYVSCYDDTGSFLWKYQTLTTSTGIWTLAYANNKVFYGWVFNHETPATGDNIGCVDATTGSWIDWWFGTWFNGGVNDLLIDGNKMYIAGSYTTYNSTACSNNIVCINI